MSVKLFRIILPVSNIDRAASFYSAILNMPGNRISSGRHYFDCEGVILACFDPNADGDNYTPQPLSEWLYFAVDDLDATHSACSKAGAQFLPGDIHGTPAGKPSKRPWGERSFYMTDPFGNKICFVDRSTSFTGRTKT